MTDYIEEWKPVVGAEGWYEVSSLGRIRRLMGGRCARPGRILNPSINEKGYYQTVLCIGPIHRTVRVHKVVAAAFISKCPPGMQVNHIDCAKTNNHASNLEYLSSRDNSRHALCNRSRWATVKLTPQNIRAIRLMEGSASCPEIASIFGIRAASVSGILRGHSWSWLD